MDKFILIKANMKHKKGTYIGIFVLMFIITMSLTVIMSVIDNMNDQMKEANEESDIGDFAAFISDDFVTDDLKDKILSNEHVERIKDERSIAFLKPKINEKPLNEFLHVIDGELNSSQYRVYNQKEDGFIANPEPLKSGEIYVPISYKSSYNCKVGDILTTETPQGVYELKIKAFVEDPYLGAVVIGVKEAYISSEDFQIIDRMIDEYDGKDPDFYSYHIIHIYQSEPKDLSVADLKKNLNDECELINYSYATLSKEDSTEYSLMLPTTFGEILFVFVGLLFVIVLIVMGHSISTGIEMDYVNLGVLKSQGFTQRDLRTVLVFQYLLAEVLGAVFGVLCSLPLVKILGGIFQNITGLLARADISIGKCLIIIFALLFVGALFVYMKTAKVIKISPIRAISGGREIVYFDNLGTVKVKKKWMTLRLALRQFTSNKKQYIGIILIVSILVYFLMSITLMMAGIRLNTIFELFGGVSCDINVEYNGYYENERKDEIVGKISEISNVTYALNSVHRYVIVDGMEYNTVIYDQSEEFKSILEGRAPLYDNEILLTELVSDTLGIGVGDTLAITYQDKEEEYLVSGIFISTVDVGKCIGFSLDGIMRIADVEPSKGYIRIEDQSKADEIVTMLNNEYSDILMAEAADNKEGLTQLIMIALTATNIFIYTISIFFSFVVVSMVCKKTFLKERQDIGIYKAMGFTASRLRFGFALRFLCVSVIGCGLGIVLSMSFNAQMMKYLLSSSGITNFKVAVTPETIIVPTLLVCTCFFVFAYLSSYKIKHVQVRELVVE